MKHANADLLALIRWVDDIFSEAIADMQIEPGTFFSMEEEMRALAAGAHRALARVFADYDFDFDYGTMIIESAIDQREFDRRCRYAAHKSLMAVELAHRAARRPKTPHKPRRKLKKPKKLGG